MLKKYIITFILIYLIGIEIKAQYFYSFYGNEGKNPGNLNNDFEIATNPSWKIIARGIKSEPIWSETVFLPENFNFLFNGNLVKAFKVSTSGVLTFDTTANTVPAHTNQILPSSEIPNNSILIWGLAALETNDQIRVKHFQNSTKSQFWIQFSAYSTPGSSGTNWTYWSIVLEENTNDIFIVDQRTFASPLSLTLGIQIDLNTATQVDGAPNTTSFLTNSGNNNTSNDNVYYRFINRQQPLHDIELTNLTFEDRVVVNMPFVISGTLRNYGTEPIESILIKYEINSQTYQGLISGLNILKDEEYSFIHPLNYLFQSNDNLIEVKVWTDNLNDEYNLNDTLKKEVQIFSFLADKKVVIEQGTGTWCIWCPYGKVMLDSLVKIYGSKIIPIEVHNNDPMVLKSYDDSLANYISEYPSALVDRIAGEYDPSKLFDVFEKQLNKIPECSVDLDVNYNLQNRTIQITITSIFAINLIDDVRFNGVITQDHVRGEGIKYAQANGFLGDTIYPVGIYAHLPNPVPASQMEYNYVARKQLDNWQGIHNSLPDTLFANSTYSYTSEYLIPDSIDFNNLNVIAWVNNVTTKEIYNANSFYIKTNIEPIKQDSFFVKIYPNPSNNKFNIHVNSVYQDSGIEIIIFDVIGNVVWNYENNLKNITKNNIQWIPDSSIGNGVYIILIKNGKQQYFRKVVLNR